MAQRTVVSSVVSASGGSSGLLRLEHIADESVITVQGMMQKRIAGGRWHPRFCYMIENRLYVTKMLTTEEGLKEYYSMSCYDLATAHKLNVSLKTLAKACEDGAAKMLSVGVTSAGSSRLSLRLMGTEDECKNWMQPLIGFQKVPSILNMSSTMQHINEDSIEAQIKANHKGKETLAEQWTMIHEGLNCSDDEHVLHEEHEESEQPTSDSLQSHEVIVDKTSNKTSTVPPVSSWNSEQTLKDVQCMEDLLRYTNDARSATLSDASSRTFPLEPSEGSSAHIDDTQRTTDSGATPETKYFSSVSTSDEDLSVSDSEVHTALSFYTEKDVVSSSPSRQTSSAASYKINTEGENISIVKSLGSNRDTIPKTDEVNFIDMSSYESVGSKDHLSKPSLVLSRDVLHKEPHIDEPKSQETFVPKLEPEPSQCSTKQVDTSEAAESPEKSFKMIWVDKDEANDAKKPKAWYDMYKMSDNKGDNEGNDKEVNAAQLIDEEESETVEDDVRMFYCRSKSMPVCATGPPKQEQSDELDSMGLGHTGDDAHKLTQDVDKICIM